LISTEDVPYRVATFSLAEELIMVSAMSLREDPFELPLRSFLHVSFFFFFFFLYSRQLPPHQSGTTSAPGKKTRPVQLSGLSRVCFLTPPGPMHGVLPDSPVPLFLELAPSTIRLHTVLALLRPAIPPGRIIPPLLFFLWERTFDQGILPKPG